MRMRLDELNEAREKGRSLEENDYDDKPLSKVLEIPE